MLADMGIINALDTHQRLVDSLDTTDLIIHIGNISFSFLI